MAGLLWQKYAEQKILLSGVEKTLEWECLYVHREKKLLLSVYVDDLKMVGVKANLAPMWIELKQEMDLDPPTRMVDNQYLGCS